jgi:hypothetical protein
MKSQPLPDRHTIAHLWSDLYQTCARVAPELNAVAPEHVVSCHL